MLHKEWEDLIPFYVNQSLPDHQALELAAHLANCGSCQKALEEWRNIAGALQSSADEWSRDLPPLSREVRARINGAIPANIISMPPPPKIRFTQPLPPAPYRKRASFPLLPFAAAAAVAIIVFGAIFAVGLRGFLSTQTMEAEPTQQVAVNWQTNTPRPEETLVPTYTPTNTEQVLRSTTVQPIVPTDIPPSATYTVTPFIPTEAATLVPFASDITQETNPAGVARMGGEQTPEAVGQIVTFYTTTNTVQPGGMVILNWEVLEANRVQVVADFNDDGIYDFDQDNLPLSGTTQAVISSSNASIETFYLRAYGRDMQVYSEASVSVAIQCPYTYFFFESDCPDGSEVQVSVSIQRFENGYILLRSFSYEGLVLFDDGTVGELGMMDEVVGTPPDGLLPPAPELMSFYRTGLGWATGTMEMVSAMIGGEPPATTRQSLWITLPNGEVFRMNSENGNFTGWN